MKALSHHDWRHWTIVIVVFGITGTLSVVFSQFMLTDVLHLEGGFWSGPWSYRLAYLLLVAPFYSVTLVVIGTLFGKHAYFRQRVLSTWGRLLPSADHEPGGVALRRPEATDRRSQTLKESGPGYGSHLEDADDHREALQTPQGT